MEKSLKHILWRTLAPFFARKNKLAIPPDWRNIRSVLIIRPDRLGDAVLSIPVCDSIKQSFPEIKICALVNQAYTELFGGNPGIDQVIGYNRGNPLQVLRRLRNEKFDAAIVLNKKFSATASTLALASRAALRVGYNSPVFDINVPDRGERQHEIQNNLDILRFLKVPIIQDIPIIYFNDAVVQKIESLIECNRKHPDQPLVLVKPGTRVARWGWDLEKFQKVCRKLLETGEAEVFIILGPGEENLTAAFKNHAPVCPFVLPALSALELACLIRQADMLFCNHTGIMHLATATQTPVVAIFKHGDINRWGPYRIPNTVLEERNGASLSPETAVETIRQLLKKTGSRKNQ